MVSVLIVTAVAIVVVLGLVLGTIALASYARTDGGTVSVVRNGGPFDSTTIRTVLPPNSPRTFVGLFSSEHPYPSGPRYYDVVPGGDDTPGVNSYRTATSDGVDVGVTARINFTLNTDDTVIQEFDNRFGIRTYQVAGSADRLSPWEGDRGFATWLDAIIKPVLEETLRQQIGSVDCADLLASCALVQNSTPEQIAAAATTTASSSTEVVQAIQTNVQDALAVNVRRALGGDFLTNISFSLTGVDLPAQIRDAITTAQTAFAGASQAQAALNSARLEADAQVERQRGYTACTTCAEIDRIRAEGDALARLPAGVQVYAPGGGAAISVGPR